MGHGPRILWGKIPAQTCAKNQQNLTLLALRSPLPSCTEARGVPLSVSFISTGQQPWRSFPRRRFSLPIGKLGGGVDRLPLLSLVADLLLQLGEEVGQERGEVEEGKAEILISSW